MTDLHSLLTRVEAATGPDRELDEEIFSALDLAPKTFFDSAVVSHSIRSRVVNTADGKLHLDAFEIGRYTASLDAALALVEEMLPWWDWSIHCDNGRAIAGIQPPSEDGCDLADCEAATPALAICTAILRALIAKQEVEDAG